MAKDIFTSVRLIDGKLRKVIVDDNGDIINKNPNKEDLKGLRKWIAIPYSRGSKDKYSDNKYTDKIKKNLLVRLAYFYEENGRVPTCNDFNGNPKYSNFSTYQRWFGSWDKAIEMAGLLGKRERKRSNEYTDKELLERLMQFEEENGRLPTEADFDGNPNYPSFTTYARRFESWNNALKMAGLQVNAFTETTNEELLGYLTQFDEENGMSPTKADFDGNPNYPSFTTYARRFESWENALKLVGLDVDSIARKRVVKTTKQKARLFEIFVLHHFVEKGYVDVSGDNCKNPFDGICPNGQIYDAKSSSLRHGLYYQFHLNKGGGVDFYYLGAFNEDYSYLTYGWRIPGDFTDRNSIKIGIGSSYTYNLGNMKEYKIADKSIDEFNDWADRIKS